MPWTSKHIDWLNNAGATLTTSCGKTINILEFCYDGNDDDILSEWAKHFRNHYCFDDEIDYFAKGYNYTRKQYLNNIKFPSKNQGLGPGLRAGDFGEILVADYIQYRLKYWVPRTRYGNRTTADDSTKGCDILGFQIHNLKKASPKDTLIIIESKVQFSGKKVKPKLQDAVDHSIKDEVRKAESLNAIKQRLYDKNESALAETIDRFQDKVSKPYKELSGAAALFDSSLLDEESITSCDTSDHPNNKHLMLIVIHGKDMMKLVNELYRRAADEA